MKRKILLEIIYTAISRSVAEGTDPAQDWRVQAAIRALALHTMKSEESNASA